MLPVLPEDDSPVPVEVASDEVPVPVAPDTLVVSVLVCVSVAPAAGVLVGVPSLEDHCGPGHATALRAPRRTGMRRSVGDRILLR